MSKQFSLRQKIGHVLTRAGRIISGAQAVDQPWLFNNPFSAQVIRRAGVKMTPRVVGMANGHNDLTIVGKNHALDVVFGAAAPVTQIDPWYIGLIDQSPTPTLAEADTLASHAGWTELTDYAGNRKEWDDADAAAKVKGTTTVSQFDINATKTVHGIFVCSVATTTTGVLWATGSFDTTLPVVSGDELKITYGLRT
jgi:hypothetical protein|tara:strand:- start:126 stop:713 length:588 start_codon:yes stop_codon:yes gene_type:complete